ncbi:MAG: hypothetical protein M3Q07_20275 [Pseudobdellovibrionaceae bacterium]|nr:hypothetical protein [Pseudobdellovibrionaceae bacterium]
MDSKLGIAVVVGLGLALYVFVPGKSTTVPSPSENTRKMQLQAVPVKQGERAAPVLDLKSIQKQRDVYRDQLALGIVSIRPKMQKNKWVFSLDYAPIARQCVNGDIDLIQRHLTEDQTLLWAWEAQGGDDPVFRREVAVKDLGTAFTQTLELPVSATPRYYRLALCLHPQAATCARLAAVDYRVLENRDRKTSLRSGLFFSQYFRVDEDGVQVFDSRVVKNIEAYKKFAKKVDGNSNADPFLEEMVGQQKNLGSLPVDVKKDKVNINLYVRKDKGC